MRVREGSIVRHGKFVALIEEHALSRFPKVWRYAILHEETGEELYDGWAGDLHEAEESASRHLAYLCDEESKSSGIG